MSANDGLSIFDDDSADEPTRVIPRMPKSAASDADVTRPVQASAPAPRAPVASPASPPATAAGASSLPQLPLVRRGGYDKEAVDRHLRTVAAEKAGLSASLNEAQARTRQLEAELADLRKEMSENERPSYAGLGGKASQMLRLAEEQAEEVVAQANLQATQVREQAMKDAAAIKAQAESDAEDMRVVQLGELDEQRTRSWLPSAAA